MPPIAQFPTSCLNLTKEHIDKWKQLFPHMQWRTDIQIHWSCDSQPYSKDTLKKLFFETNCVFVLFFFSYITLSKIRFFSYISCKHQVRATPFNLICTCVLKQEASRASPTKVYFSLFLFPYYWRRLEQQSVPYNFLQYYWSLKSAVLSELKLISIKHIFLNKNI